MSKFNSYVQKVDKIARDVFAECTAAEKALKQAEAKSKEYPQRSGMVDFEYAAKSSRAQADLAEARKTLYEIKSKMLNCSSEIAAIRKELAAALDEEFAAKPEAVDAATMELLKTGILSGDEYARLMNSAAAAGNVTMTRIIGRYAADAAEEAAKKYGERDQRAVKLRAVSYQGNIDGAGSKLEAFDVLAEAFRRTANNTAMVPHWDELTGPIIETF